jgi:diguanylate cyclase (GGDEF)-like protein
VTIGAGHPEADEPAADAGGVAGRDLTGVVRFAVAQRRGEHERAHRVQGELRETVWTLVRGVHDVVGAEAAAGERLARSVERVQAAVGAASHEGLREAALAAASELTTLLAQRERERRAQVTALGGQITRLGAALEEARRDGAIDPLTGLGNRRALDEAMANAVTLQALWGTPASLVVFDVDGLKAVNDAAGHQAGDEALRAVAHETSRVFLRAGDAPCRFGGDEFAIVLRDTPIAGAARLADRLVAAVAERAAGRAGERLASTSGDASALPAFGISAGAVALAPGESAADWLVRGDAALYAAKRAGRGRVVVG